MAEVRAHLARKEVAEPVAEAVVAELIAQGFLDDARFAQRFAEDRRTLDGWGAERIAERLSAAGIAREHVDAVCAERDPADERAAAVAVLERRLKAPPADERERDRALRLLVRRGYDLEVAYDAVRVHAGRVAPASGEEYDPAQ